MSNLRHLIRGISQLDVNPKHPDSDLSKYDKYIARLRAPISLSESVTTANKLVSWISAYQLGNPAEPWIAGKRLVRHEMPTNARLAGLHLFQACVRSRLDLSPVVRLMFFNDLQKEFTKEDFDHQLLALVSLSKDARDISGFDTDICTCVTLWVDRALANLDMRKQLIRRSVPLTGSMRHQDLRNVILFMTNLVKFNFSILEEKGVSSMVDRVVLTCKRTADQEDIRQALTFFDAVIRYGYIPLNSLPEVVNVVCSVYRGLESLQDSALSVMQNLLRSHMSQTTLRALRSIVQGTRNVHDDVILGALSILTTRWTTNFQEHATYSFTIESLFEAYKQGLASSQLRDDRNQVALDNGYLLSVLQIIRTKPAVSTLSYDDWTLPIEVMILASRSLDHKAPSRFRQKDATKDIDIDGDIHETFSALVAQIEDLYRSDEITMPISHLAELWSVLSQFLPISSTRLLFQYYDDELACYPSDPAWLQNIETLVSKLFLDVTQSQETRCQILRHIGGIMELVASTEAVTQLHPLILTLLQSVGEEPDSDSSKEAVGLIVHIAQYGSLVHSQKALKALESLLGASLSDLPSDLNELPKPEKSETSSSISSSIRSPILGASRPLSLAVSTPSRMNSPIQLRSEQVRVERQAPVVSRAAVEGLVDTFLLKLTQPVTQSVPDLFLILLNSLLSSSVHKDVRLQIIACLARIRADSEHCIYLDLESSDIKNPQDRSKDIYVSPDRYEGIKSFYTSKPSEKNSGLLALDRYLGALCSIIADEPDWQICVAAIEVARQQLSNRQLFPDCEEQLQDLRTILCDRLTTPRALVLVLPPDVKREDVMVHLIRLLSILIGYHHQFSKQHEDEIVAVLQHVLMKYQKATPACIHTLTICAYEIPLSTTKNLAAILMRLSQLITSMNASVHILEFLSALAKLPDLYVNFREDDYRRIFGVALQHIQHSNATARDAIAADHDDPLLQPMPAYVLSLAFEALYAWFLAVKLPQRPKYLKWIVDGLLAANPHSKALDERSQVCYDFLVRFCYSNADIRSAGTVFSNFEVELSSSKSWLYGNAVLTLRTMHLSGLTELVIRRPSGTTSFLCKPNSDSEALSIISSSDAKALVSDDVIVGPTEQYLRNVLSGVDTTAFTPSHMLLQISVPPELNNNEKPFLLQEDDFTRRALGTLDRIPVVDFHKIGIIYVGRGQTKQSEILANTYGSPEYVAFLENLGDLVRLKDNANIYTGGLDSVADEDGEFAYARREKITQIIFHTCTLMPTRLDTDPECNRKKSHIGNDFVNVIWNSSNHPYDPATVPSEFNFINIVVSPDAYQVSRSFDTGTRQKEAFYKVKLLPKKGLPAITPITEWQLISASQVSNFVRTIAVHCNIYAQIHHAQGQYTSMWRQRLERITTLRQRTQSKLGSLSEEEEKSHGYNFTAFN